MFPLAKSLLESELKSDFVYLDLVLGTTPDAKKEKLKSKINQSMKSKFYHLLEIILTFAEKCIKFKNCALQNETYNSIVADNLHLVSKVISLIKTMVHIDKHRFLIWQQMSSKLKYFSSSISLGQNQYFPEVYQLEK